MGYIGFYAKEALCRRVAPLNLLSEFLINRQIKLFIQRDPWFWQGQCCLDYCHWCQNGWDQLWWGAAIEHAIGPSLVSGLIYNIRLDSHLICCSITSCDWEFGGIEVHSVFVFWSSCVFSLFVFVLPVNWNGATWRRILCLQSPLHATIVHKPPPTPYVYLCSMLLMASTYVWTTLFHISCFSFCQLQGYIDIIIP